MNESINQGRESWQIKEGNYVDDWLVLDLIINKSLRATTTTNSVNSLITIINVNTTLIIIIFLTTSQMLELFTTDVSTVLHVGHQRTKRGSSLAG